MRPAAPTPRRRYGFVAFALLGVAGIAVWPALVVPSSARLQRPPAQLNEAADPLDSILSGILDEVDYMQARVEREGIVDDFGKQAASLAAKAEAYGPDVFRSVEASLHGLYLEQLAVLRQRATARYTKKDKDGIQTLRTSSKADVTKADDEFVKEASSLMLPGSDWDYNPERYALRASLEGLLRRAANKQEESEQARQTKEATKEVIRKIQASMEVMQSKLQAARAGMPTIFSFSYRVPELPLQVLGRYSQGRGSVEFRLAEDRDPINADAGFVQGLFNPANLGLSLSLVF